MTPPAPLQVPFPGHARLIAQLDAATQAGDSHAVTAAVRQTLCQAIRDPDITLPDCVHSAFADHYARRELYRSPAHGYSVVAMTWGPGQATPIHDHDGQWCVEGVWRGALEITQYELLEHEGARYLFRPTPCVQAGLGSAGSLIPPHEYHTIANASGEHIAVSLHVYQSPITRCARFFPDPDTASRATDATWCRREEAHLTLDPA